MTEAERRRSIRILLPAGEIRVSSGDVLALVGRIIDISLGGVRISASAEFALHDVLTISVALPGGERFECTARVMHVSCPADMVRNSVYGLEFIDFGQGEKSRLSDYLMRAALEADACREERAT